MMNDFAHNLGLNHVSRKSIVDHQPKRFCKKKKTQKLLPDPISNTAILVLDKSSIYTRKGLFCKFQRLNYSIHKKPPFVNSFITATYGYIVDVYVVGSFFANGRNNKPLFYHTLRKQMQGVL